MLDTPVTIRYQSRLNLVSSLRTLPDSGGGPAGNYRFPNVTHSSSDR